ncbi:MAG: cell division protein FtsZ [Oscillospiraceae bacterium]|nr:cell division protein FtsZ [Oscillospiraceae bacterium]
MAFAPDNIDDGFEIVEDFQLATQIMVFGVGGAGGNAVEHMVNSGVGDVEYVIANTDVAALRSKDGSKMTRIQIGRKTTRGQGAGNDPTRGRQSAEENREDIADKLDGVSMLFVAAGMGGGTGTGAAPVISAVAKEKGILTVGVVTKPFDFEGKPKMREAIKGVEEMKKNVDALIVVPNERIKELKGSNITIKNAFEKVDEILTKAVMGIISLIHQTGYLNIDFADICSTLRESGIAHMAIGTGKGDRKVEEAIEEVMNSPLLETSISGARRGLLNVSLPETFELEEFDALMKKITENFDTEAKYKCGVVFDDKLEKDEISIIAIATDFCDDEPDAVVNVAVNAKAKSDDLDEDASDSAAASVSTGVQRVGFVEKETQEIDTLLQKFNQSRYN